MGRRQRQNSTHMTDEISQRLSTMRLTPPESTGKGPGTLGTGVLTPARSEEASEWRTVPVDPPESMWGGLARAIIMWTRFNRPSEQALLRHLKASGETIPEWLAKECRDIDHVPPKGSVAVWVYRAMLDAAPSPAASDEEARLRTALEKAKMAISGGLCYFSAEAKHAQLNDAMKIIEAALSPERTD
jgi:hypothetical protein